ncbi:universal stress protein [Actinoplanes sp. N902-109]|uniref:universal stress protein n=1 Tax=Actinoplanes sp. (strain N902-109) TaxID=649831 RepID=UPI00032947BA|nr:universal stress protein [Actinoplanes sp. N902-109]AGL16957.1 UspA domain-containing protein [Actinoplanes sp. N902-109]
MTTRRIVVGFDRSPDAQVAAGWALDEAARTGAAVEFLYAYEWPLWAPAASLAPGPAVWPDNETDQAIRTTLRDAVAAARQTHPGVPTHVSIVNNRAALTLIGRSADAAMIVLGCRGHSAVSNLLGSVSVAVTAHARCPVVVVRGRPGPAAPVVVGVDDSPSAQLALAFAVEEAAARAVPLRAIRAFAPVTGLWEGTPMDTRAVTGAERQPFDELIAGWREKYPMLTVSAEALVQHPAATLVEAAATAQLLVVGSRGHGTVTGMLLGSVSQHLLRHAACTIAVVHDRQSLR